MILDELKMRLIEIADALNISKGYVECIVNDYLCMRKLCGKYPQRKQTKNKVLPFQ